MPAEPQNPAVVECRTPEGRVLAQVLVWPPRGSESMTGEAHPLIRWSDAEAQAHGEEPVQLRERCRYVYRLKLAESVTLPLHWWKDVASLTARRRKVTTRDSLNRETIVDSSR